MFNGKSSESTTHYKVKPLGHQLITVNHDADTAHAQLNVVAFLLRLKEIEGCTAGHKQQIAELELTLDAKVLHRQVVLPVVGEGRKRAKVRFIVEQTQEPLRL